MDLSLMKWVTLLCPMIISLNAIPAPGLLKVPKVYNALITSDQNLEPSRAYPVIQPVVHRTAIGYAPPYYYTQIGPGFVGPQILPIPGPIPAGPGSGVEPESTERPAKGNPDVEEVEVNVDGKYVDEQESSTGKERATDDDSKPNDPSRERVPLSFFPNYQSLYYNPFFYGYNPYLHVAPGTYYFDYRPPGRLVPVPPPPPLPISPQLPQPSGIPNIPSSTSSPSSSSSQREKKRKTKIERPVM